MYQQYTPRSSQQSAPVFEFAKFLSALATSAQFLIFFSLFRQRSRLSSVEAVMGIPEYALHDGKLISA